MVDAGRQEVEEISGLLVALSDVEEGECSVPDRFTSNTAATRFRSRLGVEEGRRGGT